MNILFSLARIAVSCGHTAPRATVRPANSTNCLTRTFVETGDERCPLAGIWSRLDETGSATDDPQLTRPAMRRLLSWRASYLLPASHRLRASHFLRALFA